MSGAHTALLREPRTNSNAKGSARSSSLGYKQLPGGSGQTPGGALSQRAAGETMTSSRAVPTMPRGAGGTSGWGGGGVDCKAWWDPANVAAKTGAEDRYANCSPNAALCLAVWQTGLREGRKCATKSGTLRI